MREWVQNPNIAVLLCNRPDDDSIRFNGSMCLTLLVIIMNNMIEEKKGKKRKRKHFCMVNCIALKQPAGIGIGEKIYNRKRIHTSIQCRSSTEQTLLSVFDRNLENSDCRLDNSWHSDTLFWLDMFDKYDCSFIRTSWEVIRDVKYTRTAVKGSDKFSVFDRNIYF